MAVLGFAGSPTVKTLEYAQTVSAQSRRIVRSAQRRLRMLALEWAARKTSKAPAARLRERPDDVIAHVDLGDVRTDLGRDPRNFMTQH